MRNLTIKSVIGCCVVALPSLGGGQTPTQSGQAAYGAMAEVVRILEADPKTDWSQANIEALRQHLIDMDAVTMTSAVKQRTVAGGLEMNVTGTGRTVSAIRAMLTSHAGALEMEGLYHASAVEIPGGARLTVTALDARDAKTIARIRGLGFAGIITEANHHAQHHLALARGGSMDHMH